MTDMSPSAPHHPQTAPQPEDVNADKAAEPPPSATEAKRPEAPKVKPRVAIIAALIGIVAVGLTLYAWKLPPFSSAVQRTDNANVRGQVTVIAPQVNGYVADVLVQDFANVQAGQPLVRIDDRIYRQRLEQARANLARAEADLSNAAQTTASRRATFDAREAEVGAARAQLARAQADMNRIGDLARDGSVSLRERDQAVAALRQAEAGVRQAEAAREVSRQDITASGVSRESLAALVASAHAAVGLAEIDLSNTVIAAPEAGQLGQVGARRGQYVTAGSQLVSLVPPSLWVIANFKERQTANMHIGQAATLTIDALGDRRFTGRLEQISPATGSEFAVLPAQNATGNFTKIAQRLPVRIVLEPDQPGLERLRPGMSVVARVDTASQGHVK